MEVQGVHTGWRENWKWAMLGISAPLWLCLVVCTLIQLNQAHQHNGCECNCVPITANIDVTNTINSYNKHNLISSGQCVYGETGLLVLVVDAFHNAQPKSHTDSTYTDKLDTFVGLCRHRLASFVAEQVICTKSLVTSWISQPFTALHQPEQRTIKHLYNTFV